MPEKGEKQRKRMRNRAFQSRTTLYILGVLISEQAKETKGIKVNEHNREGTESGFNVTLKSPKIQLP